MSNIKKIVADTYGHCVLCHTNMIYEQVIDSKVQQRFHTDYGEITYLLDDGSNMRVAVCKKCQAIMEDDIEEKGYIMDCVKEGWKAETRKLVEDKNKTDWDEKRRKKYLDRYNKLNIVIKSDNVAKDVLNRRLKDHRKSKKEKINGSNK